MGLGNVMEHYPEVYPEGTVTSVSDIPGFEASGSGSLLPKGPKMEFKIIDYGLVELNDKLAYTAGGTTPAQTLAKLEEGFGQPDGEGVDLSFGPEGGDSDKCDQWGFHKPRRTKSKNGDDYYILKPKRMSVAKKAHGKLHKDNTQDRVMLNGAKGPVEKMYRRFWARKGDVFHLLLALGTILNERVWLKEDEREVRMFAHLVFHVTGVKVTAYFASPDERPSVLGRRDKTAEFRPLASHSEVSDEEDEDEDFSGKPLYGKRKGPFGCFQRSHMFYRAHAHPFNSGLLAGEALVSPFFGGTAPQAAPQANTNDILAYKK